uniref:Uncharacterized protein n=1 Tax=Rhizophora mucronata TaxID=61149 RepID=A0A2P2IK30_RHIMU
MLVFPLLTVSLALLRRSRCC